MLLQATCSILKCFLIVIFVWGVCVPFYIAFWFFKRTARLLRAWILIMASHEATRKCQRKVSEFFVEILESKIKRSVYYELLRGHVSNASDDIKHYVRKYCRGEELLIFFKRRSNYFLVNEKEEVGLKFGKREIFVSDESESEYDENIEVTEENDNPGMCRKKLKQEISSNNKDVHLCPNCGKIVMVAQGAISQSSCWKCESKKKALHVISMTPPSSSSSSLCNDENEHALQYFINQIKVLPAPFYYRNISYNNLPEYITTYLRNKYNKDKIERFLLDNCETFSIHNDGSVSLVNESVPSDSYGDEVNELSECNAPCNSDNLFQNESVRRVGKKRKKKNTCCSNDTFLSSEALRLTIKFFTGILEDKHGLPINIQSLRGHLSQASLTVKNFVNCNFKGKYFKKLFTKHPKIFKVIGQEITLSKGYLTELELCETADNEYSGKVSCDISVKSTNEICSNFSLRPDYLKDDKEFPFLPSVSVHHQLSPVEFLQTTENETSKNISTEFSEDSTFSFLNDDGNAKAFTTGIHVFTDKLENYYSDETSNSCNETVCEASFPAANETFNTADLHRCLEAHSDISEGAVKRNKLPTADLYETEKELVEHSGICEETIEKELNEQSSLCEETIEKELNEQSSLCEETIKEELNEQCSICEALGKELEEDPGIYETVKKEVQHQSVHHDESIGKSLEEVKSNKSQTSLPTNPFLVQVMNSGIFDVYYDSEELPENVKAHIGHFLWNLDFFCLEYLENWVFNKHMELLAIDYFLNEIKSVPGQVMSLSVLRGKLGQAVTGVSQYMNTKYAGDRFEKFFRQHEEFRINDSCVISSSSHTCQSAKSSVMQEHFKKLYFGPEFIDTYYLVYKTMLKLSMFLKQKQGVHLDRLIGHLSKFDGSEQMIIRAFKGSTLPEKLRYYISHFDGVFYERESKIHLASTAGLFLQFALQSALLGKLVYIYKFKETTSLNESFTAEFLENCHFLDLVTKMCEKYQKHSQSLLMDVNVLLSVNNFQEVNVIKDELTSACIQILELENDGISYSELPSRLVSFNKNLRPFMASCRVNILYEHIQSYNAFSCKNGKVYLNSANSIGACHMSVPQHGGSSKYDEKGDHLDDTIPLPVEDIRFSHSNHNQSNSFTLASGICEEKVRCEPCVDSNDFSCDNCAVIAFEEFLVSSAVHAKDLTRPIPEHDTDVWEQLGNQDDISSSFTCDSSKSMHQLNFELQQSGDSLQSSDKFSESEACSPTNAAETESIEKVPEMSSQQPIEFSAGGDSSVSAEFCKVNHLETMQTTDKSKVSESQTSLIKSSELPERRKQSTHSFNGGAFQDILYESISTIYDRNSDKADYEDVLVDHPNSFARFVCKTDMKLLLNARERLQFSSSNSKVNDMISEKCVHSYICYSEEEKPETDFAAQTQNKIMKNNNSSVSIACEVNDIEGMQANIDDDVAPPMQMPVATRHKSVTDTEEVNFNNGTSQPTRTSSECVSIINDTNDNNAEYMDVLTDHLHSYARFICRTDNTDLLSHKKKSPCSNTSCELNGLNKKTGLNMNSNVHLLHEENKHISHLLSEKDEDATLCSVDENICEDEVHNNVNSISDLQLCVISSTYQFHDANHYDSIQVEKTEHVTRISDNDAGELESSEAVLPFVRNISKPCDPESNFTVSSKEVNKEPSAGKALLNTHCNLTASSTRDNGQQDLHSQLHSLCLENTCYAAITPQTDSSIGTTQRNHMHGKETVAEKIVPPSDKFKDLTVKESKLTYNKAVNVFSCPAKSVTSEQGDSFGKLNCHIKKEEDTISTDKKTPPANGFILPSDFQLCDMLKQDHGLCIEAEENYANQNKCILTTTSLSKLTKDKETSLVHSFSDHQVNHMDEYNSNCVLYMSQENLLARDGTSKFATHTSPEKLENASQQTNSSNYCNDKLLRNHNNFESIKTVEHYMSQCPNKHDDIDNPGLSFDMQFMKDKPNERHKQYSENGIASSITQHIASVSSRIVKQFFGHVVLVTKDGCIIEVHSGKAKKLVYCSSDVFQCAKHRNCSKKVSSLFAGEPVFCRVLSPVYEDSIWVASCFTNICHETGEQPESGNSSLVADEVPSSSSSSSGNSITDTDNVQQFSQTESQNHYLQNASKNFSTACSVPVETAEASSQTFSTGEIYFSNYVPF